MTEDFLCAHRRTPTWARGPADDDPRVNAHRGAIETGYPLGMSGTGLATIADRHLTSDSQSVLATFCGCVGVSQGIARVLHAD